MVVVHFLATGYDDLRLRPCGLFVKYEPDGRSIESDVSTELVNNDGSCAQDVVR